MAIKILHQNGQGYGKDIVNHENGTIPERKKGITLISYSNKKIWAKEKYGDFSDYFPLFFFI
jgi:hypothetical protein